jgi:bifunctional UDP-N-acetylglucosamine pyrophosphorylase/glucosamine-1-phosphate N-acetyltransferase
MPQTDVAAIVLAAGKGTRMRSEKPKVLHPLAGRPMIAHLLETVRQVGGGPIVVVVGPDMDDVRTAVAPAAIAVQTEPRGTGHAVGSARAALGDGTGTILILFGADPLVTRETLDKMVAERRRNPGVGIVVLGFRPPDPGQYGRLVLAPDGTLDRIVEYWDADEATRRIGLCNSGVMAVDGRRLFRWIDRITASNAKNEYYLTDLVAIARADGAGAVVVEGSGEELTGVDSRADLARAEAIAQKRLRAQAMANGATLIAPETVWLAWDTKIGRDVTIEPNVFFAPGVVVEDGVTIRANSYLEDAVVARGAIVGPFARLRPGTTIGAEAHIGNFVEIKNAAVEAGAKINHLTYVGDARVGAQANVGAGTITANYDGFRKSRTEIGAGASIGSNAVLVAPVSVGNGAIVGAGAVITEDVPADALAVTRAPQVVKPGWAAQKRARAGRKKKEGR